MTELAHAVPGWPVLLTTSVISQSSSVSPISWRALNSLRWLVCQLNTNPDISEKIRLSILIEKTKPLKDQPCRQVCRAFS